MRGPLIVVRELLLVAAFLGLLLARLNLGESRGELLLAFLGLLGEPFVRFAVGLVGDLGVRGGALLGRDSLVPVLRIVRLLRRRGAAVPEHAVQPALPRAAQSFVRGFQDEKRLRLVLLVAALLDAQGQHLVSVGDLVVGDGGLVDVEHGVRVGSGGEDPSSLLVGVEEERAFFGGRRCGFFLRRFLGRGGG